MSIQEYIIENIPDKFNFRTLANTRLKYTGEKTKGSIYVTWGDEARHTKYTLDNALSYLNAGSWVIDEVLDISKKLPNNFYINIHKLIADNALPSASAASEYVKTWFLLQGLSYNFSHMQNCYDKFIVVSNGKFHMYSNNIDQFVNTHDEVIVKLNADFSIMPCKQQEFIEIGGRKYDKQKLEEALQMLENIAQETGYTLGNESNLEGA